MNIFEKIKHKNDYGSEYWDARQLFDAMDYNSYQKFVQLIAKAERESGMDNSHFNHSDKMVSIESGAIHKVDTYFLSKSACYEIAIRADETKMAVKEAIRYFSPHTFNQRYIYEYTEKANKFYLEKMKKLDELVKAGTLVRDDTFQKGEKRETSKYHIMYKLETLHSKDGTVGYEFLIEYDIRKPSVGIYYGCKVYVKEIQDDYNSDLVRFDFEWKSVERITCLVLNNTFPDKDFTHRFKPTDNANNGNYWPFWISLYEDEDIVEVGIRSLKIIREIYHRYIINKETNLLSDNNSQRSTKGIPIKTAFTENAYKEMADFLKATKAKKKNGEMDYFNEGLKMFEKLLEGAVLHKILANNTLYERVWNVQNNKVFALILTNFFKLLNEKYKEEYGIYYDKFENVPWTKINKLFLDVYDNSYGIAQLRNSIREELVTPNEKNEAINKLKLIMK